VKHNAEYFREVSGTLNCVTPQLLSGFDPNPTSEIGRNEQKDHDYPGKTHGREGELNLHIFSISLGKELEAQAGI